MQLRHFFNTQYYQAIKLMYVA